jgi:hypothetical protein
MNVKPARERNHLTLPDREGDGDQIERGTSGL